MYNIINNTLKLFVFEKKLKLYLIYFAVLMLTVMEAFGIALILPAIILLTDNTSNNSYVAFLEKISIELGFQETIHFFLIFFFLVYLFKFLLSVFCIFIQYNFLFNFYKDISARIYKNYLLKSFLEHVNLKSAELIRKISADIDEAVLNSALPLLLLITELTIIFGITIFLLFLNFQLTIFVMLVTSSLIFLFFLISKKKTDFWANIALKNLTSKINLMQRSFLTINEIKIFSAENLMKKKFNNYNTILAKAWKYQNTIIDTNKFFIEFTGVIMFIGLIFLFSDRIESNFIGLVSVYAASAFRFLPSMNRIIVAIQKIRYAAPSVKKINDEIYLLNSSRNFKTYEQKKQKIIFNQKIELKKIDFNFPQNKQIMKNLNLEIMKNDKIGIKGPSGSGKSTLLYLISGLIPPLKGQMIVDDNKLDFNNMEGWFSKIGFTPQFVNLIDDTIKENIIYGSNIIDEASIDKKLMEISELCLINEFLDKTENKLETLVGENGLKISGGQKQRIGLARTIFRNPEILILDESTSSLDSEIESKLLKNLFNYGLKKTLIIASHKESTLNFCEKIYEFKDLSLQRIK